MTSGREPEATETDPPAGEERAAFPVVGVGASAGGLESLERLFDALPADTGMAFVVLQHLSPDFKSLMDELLARHSDMPVRVVEHGTVVQPNHVYLLPPRKEMELEGGRLQLTDKNQAGGLTMPIDRFFRSLAREAGVRGVAIVLSGSGSDGSRGIQEVKRAGGLVLVESPETAQFDGMPTSALATGVVDASGAPERLAALVQDRAAIAREHESRRALVRTPMDAVLWRLREQYGIDFALYKDTTIGRRVRRRVSLAAARDLADYERRLERDPEELSALYHDLLIGVTEHFRDPEAFAALEALVLPRILERVPPGEEVRVWVPGCATGEEAYSLAILLHERLTAAERPVLAKILATDAHRAALERASAGLYAEEALEHVTDRRRERYFTRRQGGWQASQDLRQMIVFAPHDVTRDAPFTKLHLISCRNLLIYLEPAAQRTVLSFFHFGLVTGGFLFLGSSESPGPLAGEFGTLDEHSKLYEKLREVRLLEPLPAAATRSPTLVRPRNVEAPRSAAGASQLLPIYDQLLDRTMPPSILVDEDRHLVDSFGGAERLLRVVPRRPTTSLLDMLAGDLRTIVASAVQRALVHDGPVRVDGVPFPAALGAGALVAEALRAARGGPAHVLVTFELPGERSADGAHAAPTEVAPEALAHQRIETLEGELGVARETLQSTIEELQTSNEELQAANEELIASNEELQSTNEELHSVNEELHTVNAEHQRKIAELRELNDDMRHLLEANDAGTLFLDRRLRIRRFTPRIGGIFHVQAQDVGRELGDFSHELRHDGLADDVLAALREGTVVEREVRDREGRVYFLRVFPYRPQPRRGEEGAAGAPDEIGGVVLSLTDISALERARERVARLSAIVESSDDAILSKDLDGTILTWNGGAERLYGWSAEEIVGRSVRTLVPPGQEEEITGYLEAIRRGESVDHRETVRVRKDGSPIDVSVTISPLYDAKGEIVGASAIARDIRELKRSQRETEAREERIHLLLSSTAEAILGLDPDGRCTFANPACARMLGLADEAAIIGRNVHRLVHHSRPDGTPYPEESCPIYSVLRTGRGQHGDDEHFLRADGSAFPVEYWSYPMRAAGEADGGRVMGAVLTFLDVTERKRADDEVRTAARRREQFLAMLSHELRNPLAAVMNAASILKQAPGAAVGEQLRDVIERQAGHMTRLLDDLLDVSRITRGGIALRRGVVDLRDAIGMAVEAAGVALLGRKDDLTVELPSKPLRVHGDATRLQQVVGNLLSNALRYSKPGTAIAVRGAIDGERVELRVADRGAGIPPELLDQVFDLFVQTAQGLDRSQGGLGVGLTLVRMIVELHGGTVEARSEGLGHGSEFVVRLPRLMHRGPGRREDPESPAGARRLVVVEDHEDARRMMQILLEARGHTVVTAADGEDALEAIERERPDVALVDIGLPRVSGYEVARRVRARPELDTVVLVALTGYGREEDVKAARDAGFDDHLTKPADPARLDRVLADPRRRQADGGG